MMLIWSAAWAGGGGLYAQVGFGAGWSNTAGPLVRGDGTHLDIGAYFGPYKRSMRYGKYTRVGIRANTGLHQAVRASSSGSSTLGLCVSLARGFDLMNVGYWMGFNVGPAARVGFDFDRDTDTWSGNWGLMARAELGGIYNIWPALGVGLRMEVGADVIPGVGTSVAGGFGLTFLGRVPLVTPRRQARRESRSQRR